MLNVEPTGQVQQKRYAKKNFVVNILQNRRETATVTSKRE